MAEYDTSYSRYDDFFGREPEQLLTDNIHLLPKPCRILDIGTGQGRHTLYLTRQGYNVDALDPSQAGLDQIKKTAFRENLAINCIKSVFSEYDPNWKYSAILVFGLIQMLDRDAINELFRKADLWLEKGGFLFVTAWTTDDPVFAERKTSWDSVGRNSYRNPKGHIVTYLEPEEIMNLASGYETIYHKEDFGPWHRHGQGQPERHFRAEAVFRKPAD